MTTRKMILLKFSLNMLLKSFSNKISIYENKNFKFQSFL